MDTQNSSVIEVPNLKLAKVGGKKERKRGGGGWLGARGAGSGFSGAVGGAGAGASGVFGTGMSLAKLMVMLLMTSGTIFGAWKAGDMIAANASKAKPSAPKVFSDKDSGKYADTSGVIKQENSIPNSLGYINNDGLTDEQRAAKKAAEDAAAAKAAADAQAKADADAKEKALADAKAASATPDAAPEAAPQMAKKGLTAGKFGGMNSSLGGGGGGGLSGGAGLSGGINRGFAGMDGMGKKGAPGALSSFKTGSAASSSKVAAPSRTKSNAKGFAHQQLDQAFGAGRSALASGKNETAAAGAGAPFDNNAAQGSVISGPGMTSGAQTGPADAGGSTNQQGGGGGGGPLAGGAACADATQEPDINGNCVAIAAPPAKDAAPYQSLVDTALILMGIVAVLAVIALIARNVIGYGDALYAIISWAIGLIGVAIAAIGVAIAAMQHGDMIIGGIIAAVGGYTAYSAYEAESLTDPMLLPEAAAHVLIASALGGMAAASTKMSSVQ